MVRSQKIAIEGKEDMMSNVKNRRTIVFIMTFALAMSIMLMACGDKKSEDDTEDKEISNDIDYSVDKDALNTDIDLDAIKESADAIKNLDFNVDLNSASSSDGTSIEGAESVNEPKGEKTVYSYADVYRDGNSLAVIPNGGMNGSTKLFEEKDLNGFLDYVDSTVLEPGRKINREFFYDLMSVMLVDKDLSSDQTYIEKHMIVALAVANNFHDTPVKINECNLDANNATDYVCKVKAYDKDDIWIFNFAQDSLYMNNGATEYVSDMFKDEYRAVWLMAMDEYFELNL